MRECSDRLASLETSASPCPRKLSIDRAGCAHLLIEHDAERELKPHIKYGLNEGDFHRSSNGIAKPYKLAFLGLRLRPNPSLPNLDINACVK